MILSKSNFYGVPLDTSDPFLERNLARLEKRFGQRHQLSVTRETLRQQSGKSPHKTTRLSIEENKNRLEAVKQLRRALYEATAG